MAARATTIRRSLLTNLVLLIALTGGTILAASWYAGEKTVKDASRQLIDPTVRRTAAELDRFFGDVRAAVLIGRSWAEDGALDATDHEDLNQRFVPFLEQHPQFSSMMIANSDGEEYLLLRDALEPNVWTNRVVRAEEWGTRVLNRRWNTDTGEVEESFGELDYDPRRRIWYQEALETTRDDPIAWSQPVIFFVTKDPGITAATHVETAREGEPTVVVAFDLLLLDISRFTTGLEVSENGRGFVLVERAGAGDLQVVGLPRDPRFESDADLRDALIFTPPAAAVADESARLPDADEVAQPSLTAALDAWRDLGRPHDPFDFDVGGQHWIGAISSYPVGRNVFWIGVTVPERDLLGAIRLQRIALLAIVLLVLAIGLARAATLARRFSRPVEALVRETERVTDGDLEPGEAIRSRVREFQRLADAQNDMRRGLQATMTLEKVERDLDIARDIQRGLMPTGQPDTPGFDVVGWNKPADKTGGDYFDWLALPDNRVLITLADVTGHGIGPALIVAVCRAYMRASASDPDMKLGEALARVNDLLCEDIPDERFVTAAVGVLNVGANRCSLISAGQAPILFYHAASGDVENWPADDLPLGIAEGIAFDTTRRITFEPGDALIMLTDGFFEWADESGEQYGIERLEAFIKSHGELSAAEFIRRLHKDVLAHAHGVKQNDDLTAVVIRRQPVGAAIGQAADSPASASHD